MDAKELIARVKATTGKDTGSIAVESYVAGVGSEVGRVGGFSEAMKIHDVALRHNLPVWCGGMLESGVGRAHNIALSTLENFRLPGDVSASKRYWKEDIIEPEVTVSSKGMIAISDTPGTGYAVRKDLIEKLTKTVVEATNVPAEAVVVLIDEYSAESIGTGGVQLSGKMKK